MIPNMWVYQQVEWIYAWIMGGSYFWKCSQEAAGGMVLLWCGVLVMVVRSIYEDELSFMLMICVRLF